VQVVFNTFINNPTSVVMLGRTDGLGATSLVFADNIIQGAGGKAISIGGPLPDVLWQGNILWDNAGGPGDISVRGYISVNPGLKQDATGIFRLQADSAAIGKAVGSYPYVTTDMDGQVWTIRPDRGVILDVGADQFSTAPITNRPLTPADVGPNAP
jgi:poly(beta-D-mannuronate) lyase